MPAIMDDWHNYSEKARQRNRSNSLESALALPATVVGSCCGTVDKGGLSLTGGPGWAHG